MSILTLFRLNNSKKNMTHQLYLLRHAEAEPWSPLGNDFSRSLSSNGRHHAQVVSDWAVERLQRPDTVLCSPAKRTRQTLAPLLSHWPKLLATTDYVDSIYGASLNMLLTLAEDAFSYSERLLMVGHNPGIEQMLINLLSRNQVTSDLKMAPGTLAVIEFPGEFKRDAGNGVLSCLTRKQDL
jgi:phosphohistidine phosphatase